MNGVGNVVTAMAIAAIVIPMPPSQAHPFPFFLSLSSSVSTEISPVVSVLALVLSIGSESLSNSGVPSSLDSGLTNDSFPIFLLEEKSYPFNPNSKTTSPSAILDL